MVRAIKTTEGKRMPCKRRQRLRVRHKRRVWCMANGRRPRGGRDLPAANEAKGAYNDGG